MNRLTNVFTITVSALAVFACNSETVVATAHTKPASHACAACHQGNMSFANRDAAELAEKIRAIRDANVAHPPLGLKNTSDEAIDELAGELTSE